MSVRKSPMPASARWWIGDGIVNRAISEYAAIAWYLAKGRIGFADL